MNFEVGQRVIARQDIVRAYQRGARSAACVASGTLGTVIWVGALRHIEVRNIEVEFDNGASILLMISCIRRLTPLEALADQV